MLQLKNFVDNSKVSIILIKN